MGRPKHCMAELLLVECSTGLGGESGGCHSAAPGAPGARSCVQAFEYSAEESVTMCAVRTVRAHLVVLKTSKCTRIARVYLVLVGSAGGLRTR